MTFWQKLNELGEGDMKPLECGDVDASVQLSDEQWATLEAEFRALTRC